MSNECLICYDLHANLIFMKCLHSMCQTCMSKLQKRICPFCRTAIPENVADMKSVDNHFDFNYDPVQRYSIREPVIRIRVRRRRRRIRTATDIMDTVHGTVIIETPIYERRKRKKPKAGKNNFRKGNWTRANHRNRFMRVK